MLPWSKVPVRPSADDEPNTTFHIYCFVHGSTQEGDKENQRENLWSLN